MPFRKGQSGNPGGRSREKPIADAIRAAVNEVDPKTQRRKAQLIAEKVTELALAGESWAVQMVADRLDGKVPQALVGDDEYPGVRVDTIQRTIVDPKSMETVGSAPSPAGGAS